ncbi:hypothetical protein ACFYT4_21470 [Streptomyces sp. NPDC004609]|uniref:hypothetical protein n=1 Tax=Streptomyces sp. NPDC004609 TaxID=3364704 RepID=UPI0036AB1E60
MHQRVRLLLATALPSLLLGVWVTLLALVGAAPASGGSAAGPVTVTPASPARAEGPQRGASAVRTEARRTPVTAVHEVVATDAGSRPPTAPPVPAGAVDFAYERTLLRGEVVGPRQERAPPHSPYGPRSTRAPPSTRSS